MNEKQAKRLRRAQRAYVIEKLPGLEKVPRALEAGRRLAAMFRKLWSRCDHRARGRAGHGLCRTAPRGHVRALESLLGRHNLGDVVASMIAVPR